MRNLDSIFVETLKRKFLFSIFIDNVFFLTTLSLKNVLTVSTSGSSGMIPRLQKKHKASNKLKKQLLVERIFSKISSKYDFMNDLMSFGLHRQWKEEFVNLMEIKNNYMVLDLASGSGDIIKLILNKYNCDCIGFDSSSEMLDEARKKIKCNQVSFVNGRAEAIPFHDSSFDTITVSFGLRNFSDIDLSLKEIKRVLKKNKKFYCLEFSEINNLVFRKIFNLYSKIIPIYGEIILNNKEAYNYLIESIKMFPAQIELTNKLLDVGFKNVEVIDILDGIASIHIAES